MPKLPTQNTRIVKLNSYGSCSVQYRETEDGAVQPVTSGTVQLYSAKADGSDLRPEPPMNLVDYMTPAERNTVLGIFGNVLGRIYAENPAYMVVDRPGG